MSSAPISFHHGDTVDTRKLLNELDAANSNPFRRVDLVYQPSSQPGCTDLVLNTRDRFPVTAYTGFDNSGTAATGRSRWNMGATWGNALWHDQQLSYQFSASDNFFSRNGPVGYLSNSLAWSMPVRVTLQIVVSDCINFCAAGVRSRTALAAENLFLRKQLAFPRAREESRRNNIC
jgi:hemolysin activation/secretion protein